MIRCAISIGCSNSQLAGAERTDLRAKERDASLLPRQKIYCSEFWLSAVNRRVVGLSPFESYLRNRSHVFRGSLIWH